MKLQTLRMLAALTAFLAAGLVMRGQDLAGRAVTSPKIDARLRARAQSEQVIPVFIVLKHQPQRDIFQQAEGANELYRQVAEAREAREAVVLRTRRQAFQAIEQAIKPEQDALESRLAGLGAARISRYLGINMLTAEIPVSAIEALEADPDIARVSAVEKYAAELATSVPALGAPAFWAAGFTGQGESVGILDTGIRTNHPAFAGLSFVSQVFLANGQTDPCFADNASSAQDQQGHGTHVAGIVASEGSAGWTSYQGVAKGIGTLYNLKVAYATSCSPALWSDPRDVLAALDWAVRNTPAKVFNYSYGSPATDDDDAFTQAVDEYIDTYGLTIAFAAGNGGPATYGVIAPAIAYNGIAVANWVSRGAINESSSRGPTPGGRDKPDLAAPGTNIFSANYLWDSSPSTADDFVSGTGTSMAAAHIAGAAALLQSAGVTDPLAIKAILINSTDAPGWAADSGWGFTNLTTAQGQLYYDTGSLDPGGFRFYRVSPSADFRATITWNRHMSGGTSYLHGPMTCIVDDIGRSLCSSSGGGQNVAQLSGTDSANGVVGLAVDDALTGSEPFAIAFSTPWTRLSGPQLSVSCPVSAPVASGSSFDFTCAVTNNGDMPTWVQGQVTPPAGFSGSGEIILGGVAPGSSGLAGQEMTAPTAPGTYVFAANVSSYESYFSASASSNFAVIVYSALPPPTLLSPENGATAVSQNPTLAWSASAGATSYDVYLGTASYGVYQGASVSPPLVATVTGTSYIPAALNPGTLYYWQVVAKNGSGASSSTTRSFMTQAPQTNQQYIITSVAGRGESTSGNPALGDGGPAIAAFLDQPTALTLDAAGNLYIADSRNQRVRMVTPNGIITTVAGNGVYGYSGDGGPATSARFNWPAGLAVDGAGNLYISDRYNSLVRKVAPNGIITTVAGDVNLGSTGQCQYYGDGGAASASGLCFPGALALDAGGNLYIQDSDNEVVRKIAPGGVITTAAGGGPWYYLGDGGRAVVANLQSLGDIATDAAGNLYIAQTEAAGYESLLNNRVRKVTPDGAITTAAGGSTEGNSGDGGPATSAELEGTTNITADAAGSLYIRSGNSIRKVDPSGVINTIAGGGAALPNYSGDGGLATEAAHFTFGGLAAGAGGQVFIADDDGVVRVLAPFNAACQYALDRSAVAVPAAGGSVPIAIRTGQGCSWVAAGLPAWLGGNVFGSGPGTFNLLATANTGLLRSATFSVAGVAVSVAQAGGPCSYSLGSSDATVPAAGGAGSIAVTTGPGCPWAASSPSDWVTFTGPVTGVGSGSVNYSVAPSGGDARSGTLTIAGAPFTVRQGGGQAAGLRFVPVAPCRVADTRDSDSMDGDSSRSFDVPQSGCGIPATAQAYSLNVTAVPHGPLSYLTLWPTGQDQPGVSTLNSWGGIVVANAAIVPAGVNGAVSVYVTNPADVILDVNGYFDAPPSGSFSFYAAEPCRVADTRGANGPSLAGGETRDFAVPSSGCGLPSTAGAYSMNVTVVPPGYLGYLTTWPTGGPQPNVSTLNSWTGKVVANAAIVPAGAGGSISVFVSNPSAVVLDSNGYFAPPGGPGALSFYPVAPCRVADTRNAAGPLGGPEMEAATTRSFPIPSSACGIPATAAAYSLNVTVVPDGKLSYLTMWPAAAAQPFASTLNSWDGAVVANAAIVPAGAAGAIDVYVTDRTHVILDIDGYFAP